MADFYGRILMERYFLFYYDSEDKLHWWSWLPNAFIHYFPGPDSPDAKDDAHRHPWSTLGIMLRGGYTEVVNNSNVRSPRWLTYLSYRDNHRIASVRPGTWTLFLHGFRRQPWTFELQPCVEKCAACTEAKQECFKAQNPTLTWKQLFSLGKNAVSWVRWGSETERRLERRRLAVKRMGLQLPRSKEETSALFKRRVVGL